MKRPCINRINLVEIKSGGGEELKEEVSDQIGTEVNDEIVDENKSPEFKSEEMY